MCFGVAVHATALWGLSSMGRPLLGPNRELVEAGSELATSWIAELSVNLNESDALLFKCMQFLRSYPELLPLLRYLKDVVILTTGLQVLSGVTNYVWFLWLLVSGCSHQPHMYLYSDSSVPHS